MDKTWSFYGGFKESTQEVYMGVHEGNIIETSYETSTTNPHLREAIKNDEVKFVTFKTGTKEEMYNLEYFFLSKYDAKNNRRFFNKSNGGGPGVKKTFKPAESFKKKIDTWVNTGFWKDKTKKPNKEKERMVALFNEVQKSIDCWKTGGTKEYPVEEVSVHSLYIIEHSQARAVKIIQKKLTNLVAAFRNTARARKHITPLIVIVKDGKIVLLVDGNHRINAAHIADWDTYPVIKIDWSHFNDDTRLIKYFGRLANHVEVERTGNSLDDLIIGIRELHAQFPKYKIDSAAFKEIARGEYGGLNTKEGGMYKNIDVNNKCDQLAKLDREMLAREQCSKNFIDYSGSRLATVWYQSKLFNDNPVVFQSLDGISNSGFGAAIKYATQNYISGGPNEANLVIHFKSLSAYLTEAADIITELRQTLEFGSKSKINIFFADPFKEQIVTKLNGLQTTTKS